MRKITTEDKAFLILKYGNYFDNLGILITIIATRIDIDPEKYNSDEHLLNELSLILLEANDRVD